MLCSLLAALACGETERLPTRPSSPGGPALMTYQVEVSVVDGDDQPVPGARLSFESGDPPPAVTDARGTCSVSIESRRPVSFAVMVTKPGYEPSRYSVALESHQSTWKLRLHAIRVITAGEPARLTIRSDDPECGFDSYTCRRVRVSSPSAGLLTVEAAAVAPPAQFAVVEPWGDPGLVPPRQSTRVVAGSEVQFDIVMFDSSRSGSQEVIVKTRLER
jgi:hypothetical protein